MGEQPFKSISQFFRHQSRVTSVWSTKTRERLGIHSQSSLSVIKACELCKLPFHDYFLLVFYTPFQIYVNIFDVVLEAKCFANI